MPRATGQHEWQVAREKPHVKKVAGEATISRIPHTKRGRAGRIVLSVLEGVLREGVGKDSLGAGGDDAGDESALPYELVGAS